MIKHYLEFLPDGFWSIQLDIVGFLAVLGESSVLSNAQAASMSWTCLLPRLIPAPQALIRTARPERLRQSSGTVIGYESGNVRRQVNQISHALHQIAFQEHGFDSEDTEAYEVRVLNLKWAENLPQNQRNVEDAAFRAVGDAKSTLGPRTSIPLLWLAYGGCAESIALLIVSATQGDGMSVLAVIILSLCSTLVGLASYFRLSLPESRVRRNQIPASDVVISYPNGSFLIVKCSEGIARLYFQAEQCDYYVKSGFWYRMICFLASVLLMIGVIFLANAQPLLQVIWAAAYILLNAAYWLVAALPARWHWDMSSFETTAEKYKWYRYEDESSEPQLLDLDDDRYKGNFTEALWKAIGISGSSCWARIGEVAPNTAAWDEWLQRAEKALRPAIEDPKLEEQTEGQEQRPANSDAVSTGRSENTVLNADATEPHDIESLKERRTGKIVTNQPQVNTLPDWNYQAALTTCLSDEYESRNKGFRKSFWDRRQARL